MVIRFTKMQGIGNDFVVLNLIEQSLTLTPELIRRMSDRHFGIGCDQVLVLQKSTNPNADFDYRIYNADGSEALQCGNGVRCMARYVIDNQLSSRSVLTFATRTQLIHTELLSDQRIKVNMGEPVCLSKELISLPFSQEFNSEQKLDYFPVSMGNPHAVILVNSLETSAIPAIGLWVGQLPAFPQGINVGFAHIMSCDEIKLRVIERGVGETLACGSGACAAVVAGRMLGLLEEAVKVKLPGGELTIEWKGEGQSVWMSGPAEHVFNGEF